MPIEYSTIYDQNVIWMGHIEIGLLGRFYGLIRQCGEFKRTVRCERFNIFLEFKNNTQAIFTILQSFLNISILIRFTCYIIFFIFQGFFLYFEQFCAVVAEL